jgi:uncharacterized protein (DUF1330 family)
MTIPFKAYAIAHLRQVDFGPGIIEYLKRIDATLAPYGGGYVVHGSRTTVLEGDWVGDLIIIGFPDRQSAEAWYTSPAYRDIIALRTDNSVGDVVLVDGVTEGHRATDLLARLGV